MQALCLSVFMSQPGRGQPPSPLCEGLNVIHWAETVLLPASLPFCLTPLMAAQYKRGHSAINRACSLMKGAEVLHSAEGMRWMFACMGGEDEHSACVGIEGESRLGGFMNFSGLQQAEER